jgi:electron transfer flavoprotein alpha/beta subunit
MKIVVCLHVPPPDPDGGAALGRDDGFALAQALALSATAQPGQPHQVTALLAGTAAEVGPLERALAAGAHRAVRLSGDDYRTADFHSVGQAVAAGVRRVGGELVLAGARSDDEGLGAVPAAAARQLGFVYVSGVESIVSAADRGAVEVVVRGGGRKRRLRVKLPAVLTVGAGPPPGPPATAQRTAADVEVLSLVDPEATVVRRRTELHGRTEPASRGTEEVTSARAFIAALARR